ncbi:MAG: ribonuclease HII [Verrucomicrobia bacterium]|nr:ribonuclease HII [Verrucomicrobiota bacterium]
MTAACSFRHENELRARGISVVAGLDEVGRGPLAGPVVAAAVILPEGFRLRGLTDSKQLSPATRENVYFALSANRAVVAAIGLASAEEIDQVNILQATHRAMGRALGVLGRQPQHLLVDGRPVPALPLPQTAIVDGDAQSLSIAAASVIAKVTRDRMMQGWHRRFPQYGFDRHKGYPTGEHLRCLRTYGPCPIHRRSFAPVGQAQRSLQTALPPTPSPSPRVGAAR